MKSITTNQARTFRAAHCGAVAYTNDDGASLIPLADPLFASTTDLGMQVGSVEETHIFSPSTLNTFRAGFSRGAYALESSLLSSFPANLDFVQGLGPGGIIVNGGVTTTGLAGITSAGPNNAAGAWNRRNLYTFTDGVHMSKGIHQITYGAWLQRVQDNEDSASRQLGQATFSTLTTFLQGTTSTFQAVPAATEVGWRSWFGAVYVDDTMKLRPNLTFEAGLRVEFTDGWNANGGKASNYLASNGVLETNPMVGNSIFTANNAKHLLGPRAGLAWDPFKNGKTAIRAGYGMFYSLIDDLSFLLELGASLQRHGLLRRSAVFVHSDHSECARCAAVQPHRPGALQHLRPLRRAIQRADADRAGVAVFDRAAVDPEHGFAGLL